MMTLSRIVSKSSTLSSISSLLRSRSGRSHAFEQLRWGGEHYVTLAGDYSRLRVVGCIP